VARLLGRRLLNRLAAVTGGAHTDRGAAVAEFAMMSVLLLMLWFGVLQVAVYFYVRNIVAASAADGARYAGTEGVAFSDGGVRASMLLRQVAAAGFARDITCQGTAAMDAGTELVEAVVRCWGQLELAFLPLNLPLTIDVTARSVKEKPPQ
jgi:hypothetical protein